MNSYTSKYFRLFSLLFCCVGFPGLVQAGVINAFSVRVTQNVNDTFQVAELQAFETGTAINVAQSINGGSATASSSGFGTIPGDGNDGKNPPGKMYF